jgi:tetratricopeptide (TPR) repeat protein
VLAIILYLNILPNGFVFDDWQQIVENPFLRRPDGLRRIFTTGVWQFLGPIGVSNFYRPMMHGLFYVLFGWFRLDPAPYHAVSILLHAGVALLAYGVIARLGRERLTAAAAALLFVAHPVHVEAVAWVSAYPELLCALFSLLAIWLYLRAREAAGSAGVWLALLTGPALLAALLSKEIAVAAPLLVLCYEIAGPRFQVPGSKFAGRENLTPGAWRLAPVSMLAAVAVYLALRIHALGTLMPAQSKPVPPGEHLWTAIGLLYRYLAVQALPVRLHAFYYLDRNRSPLEPVVIAGLATAAGTAALAWFLWRRRRPELLAVPLYLLPLAPAFLLPYASVGLLMAERYAYLPSLGFCWLAAAALVAAGRRWNRRAALAVFLALLAGYSVRTVSANANWRDEIAFYRRTIADFPGFPRAYLNLGEALMRRDRMAEAREATEAAVRLDAGYPEPHVNLGLILRAQGDLESAAREFLLAARLGEEQSSRFVVSRALANLAVVYRSMGRLEESVEASRHALAADPQFAGAHNNLGYALLLQGRIGEAKRHFQAAIELDPAMDLAWSNLGLAAAIQGEWPSAMACLRRAEQLNPQSGEVQARIGDVYLAHGAAGDALRQFRRALELDPGNQRARSGLRALGEGR